MVPIPVFVFTGSIPSSLATAFSVSPNDLGIEGPVISASRTAVLYPALCMLTAIREVTIDLPTPPLPLTTAITFLILLYELVSSKKLWG